MQKGNSMFLGKGISQEEVDSMIKMLDRYNNAKTAEEGFGALNGLISFGESRLEKQFEEPHVQGK